MPLHDEWAKIVASSLDWEQAHASFDKAIADLPKESRGQRPANFPHSVWELVFHIDVAQNDLLEFCRGTNYHEIKWPDEYWPKSPTPASDEEWDTCVARIRRDVQDFKQFTTDNAQILGDKIPPPRGTGQNYLRTILVSIDHTAYHVGQIIAVRRLLNAWSAS
jgi:uncharacterized damage-inducible protein DinB